MTLPSIPLRLLLMLGPVLIGCDRPACQSKMESRPSRILLPLPEVPIIYYDEGSLDPDSYRRSRNVGKIEDFLGGLDPELIPHLDIIDSVAQRQCGYKPHENAKIRSEALLGGYLVELSFVDTVESKQVLSDGCLSRMFISGQTFLPIAVTCLWCNDEMPRRPDGIPTDTLFIP